MPVLENSPEVLFQLSNEQMMKDNHENIDEVGGRPGSIRNIWKKFELIPTPPLSPRRCTPTSGDASPTCLTDVTPASAAALQCLSDILDLDISRMLPGRNPEYSCPIPTLNQTNLTSKLIQDCMWGSHSYDDMVLRRHTEDVYDTPCPSPEPSLCTVETYFSSGESVESVDPASVFSYPLNNQEFTSGESSSEDEIDVVTIVEKPVKRKCQTICDNNNNNNSAKTLRHEPPAKRVKMNPKRTTREQTKQLDVVANRLEDPECKRNVHNVLERKRRNDLKYSFQVLRDSIPDLQGSERAPKVAILRKATDCILKLQSEQEGLLDEKSLLEKKHQSKLLKLKSLKERS